MSELVAGGFELLYVGVEIIGKGNNFFALFFRGEL